MTNLRACYYIASLFPLASTINQYYSGTSTAGGADLPLATPLPADLAGAGITDRHGIFQPRQPRRTPTESAQSLSCEICSLNIERAAVFRWWARRHQAGSRKPSSQIEGEQRSLAVFSSDLNHVSDQNVNPWLLYGQGFCSPVPCDRHKHNMTLIAPANVTVFSASPAGRIIDQSKRSFYSGK